MRAAALRSRRLAGSALAPAASSADSAGRPVADPAGVCPRLHSPHGRGERAPAALRGGRPGRRGGAAARLAQETW
ncbi:MAG: hypothetical protein WKG07_02285 [Hymenobacter sp.]